MLPGHTSTNTTYKVVKQIPLEGMKVDLLEDPEMRHGLQIISTCKSFRLEARLVFNALSLMRGGWKWRGGMHFVENGGGCWG